MENAGEALSDTFFPPGQLDRSAFTRTATEGGRGRSMSGIYDCRTCWKLGEGRVWTSAPVGINANQDGRLYTGSRFGQKSRV